MLVKSVQLGFSRCAGRATVPHPQRLAGAPQSRPRTGAVLWAKMLCTQQLGVPRSSTPVVWRPFWGGSEEASVQGSTPARGAARPLWRGRRTDANRVAPT
eukprot:551247-Alexandrium_andersonii.AAC.1